MRITRHEWVLNSAANYQTLGLLSPQLINYLKLRRRSPCSMESSKESTEGRVEKRGYPALQRTSTASPISSAGTPHLSKGGRFSGETRKRLICIIDEASSKPTCAKTNLVSIMNKLDRSKNWPHLPKDSCKNVGHVGSCHRHVLASFTISRVLISPGHIRTHLRVYDNTSGPSLCSQPCVKAGISPLHSMDGCHQPCPSLPAPHDNWLSLRNAMDENLIQQPHGINHSAGARVSSQVMNRLVFPASFTHDLGEDAYSTLFIRIGVGIGCPRHVDRLSYTEG